MKLLRIAALAFLLLPPAAASAAEKQLDQQALDIARKSAEFLAARPAMSFNWFVSYDEVENGREKLTYMRSGSNLMVRDKGFFSHVENEDSTRDFFFDGKTFTVSAPDVGYYASQGFAGTYEDLIGAYQQATDDNIPFYELMSRNLPDFLKTDFDGAAYLGITRISGRAVHHLAFSDHDEDLQVWISTDEAAPVPVVIIGTDPYQQGWPQYRAYMTQWDFEPEVADGSFTFQPAEGDEKVDLPTFIQRSSTAGGPAAGSGN